MGRKTADYCREIYLLACFKGMLTNGLISLCLINPCLGSIHLKRRTKSTRKERSRVLISGKASRVTFTETPIYARQTRLFENPDPHFLIYK
jgi:hypothetical protein